jgi:hypothetical protein
MILGPVRDILLASSDVTDIVSRRLFPHALTEKVSLPAGDMRVVGTSGNDHLGGNLKAYASMVTVDFYANDPIVTDTAVMAGIDALVGFRGQQGGVFISGVRLQSGLAQYLEGVEPGSEDYRFVSSFTAMVHWSPSC